MASTKPGKEPIETVNGLDEFRACISGLDKSKGHNIHFVFGQLEHVLRVDFDNKQIYCFDRDARAMFFKLRELINETLPDFKIQDISRNALQPKFMSDAKGFAAAPQTFYAQPKTASWIEYAVNTINREAGRTPLEEVTNTKPFKP